MKNQNKKNACGNGPKQEVLSVNSFITSNNSRILFGLQDNSELLLRIGQLSQFFSSHWMFLSQNKDTLSASLHRRSLSALECSSMKHLVEFVYAFFSLDPMTFKHGFSLCQTTISIQRLSQFHQSELCTDLDLSHCQI